MKILSVAIFTAFILAFCMAIVHYGNNSGKKLITPEHQHLLVAGQVKSAPVSSLIHKISDFIRTHLRTKKKVIGLLIIAVLAFFAYRIFFLHHFKRPEKIAFQEETYADNRIRFDRVELDTYIEEKVQQRTKELKLTNEKLRKELAQRPVFKGNLQHRLKQLKCLYGLSKLVEQPDISLPEVFQKAAFLLREAYQQPDFICAGITFDGIQYKTDNFRKSECSQHTQINVTGRKAGTIQVYYLGQVSENTESVFIQAEQDLLNAVAERLSSFAKHKHSAERLQLFRNLIDRSSDSIFVIEPKWGRFLDVNDKSCKTLGYSREELLNLTVKDIEEFIPDDSAWQQHVDKLKLERDIIEEGKHKRKDGTTFFVETSLNYISQDKGDQILALARDTTERKKAELEQALLIEKLKDSNQEIESINLELNDFAHIISHDLKAPLRGIKTLADWLSTDYADKFDKEGKEQMSLLLSRLTRMHDLIDGVLQYSRAGRAQEENVWVDLNEAVSDVVDMLAPPDNIKIDIETELPTVKCGKTRIMQVFQNLLSNAIKYMDKPNGWVKIDCVHQDGFWQFSVADNGPGIDQKHFDRIFRMFQTLTSKNEFESTGIGLTVVRKIIQLYGGKIWVESEVGKGTTFFFTLQIQQKETVDAKLSANTAC